MLADGDDYFAHETEVFNTFINRINKALAHPGTAIVFADATHISERSREKTLRRIKTDCKIIPVVFTTPFETCLEWNAKREGLARVPQSAIAHMDHDFHDPTTDSRNYGEIWFVDPSSGERGYIQ